MKQFSAGRLERQGLKVVRQMPVHIRIDDMDFANAYRVDLFVNDWLVVDVKSRREFVGHSYSPNANLH